VIEYNKLKGTEQMDNNSGMSVADVAALSGGGFGGFGNGFEGLIYLAVIASMFGGGFGWGNNGFNNAIGYQNLATQNDVQRGFDTAALQDQSRDILAAVNSGTAQSVAATNQAKYDNINVMKDVQMALASQIGDVRSMEQSILGNQNDCCCSTKMLISETGNGIQAALAQAKYENAMGLAGLEQRLTSKLDQNEITSLRDQVQQLQLAQATSGMLRFPNSWSYGAGPFPPIFGGCCGQQNI
jgi:hypothetical protein